MRLAFKLIPLYRGAWRFLLRFIWRPCDYVLSKLGIPLLFFKNLLKIGISTGQRLQELAGKKQHLAEIYLVRDSDKAIRSLLMIINQMIDQVSGSGGELNQLTVYLDRNVQFNQLSEVFSCFQLSSSIKDIDFYWVSDASPLLAYKIRSLEKVKGMDTDDVDWLAFVDYEQFNVKLSDYIRQNGLLYLEAPVSTRIWARNIFKGYHPRSYFVSMDFGWHKESSDAHWRNFFLEAWRDFPEIHFILFDEAIVLQTDFLRGLPNVIATKVLGYNFLEEFALCQQSDMYAGVFDKYAMAFIGSDKPFLLTGLGEGIRGEEGEGKDFYHKKLSRNPHQVLLPDTPMPADFIEVFKRVRSDARR